MGPMFWDFLWKSDPFERHIPVCLNMRIPPLGVLHTSICRSSASGYSQVREAEWPGSFNSVSIHPDKSEPIIGKEKSSTSSCQYSIFSIHLMKVMELQSGKSIIQKNQEFSKLEMASGKTKYIARANNLHLSCTWISQWFFFSSRMHNFLQFQSNYWNYDFFWKYECDNRP